MKTEITVIFSVGREDLTNFARAMQLSRTTHEPVICWEVKKIHRFFRTIEERKVVQICWNN